MAKEKATSVVDRIRKRLKDGGGGAGGVGGSMPEQLFFVPKGGFKTIRFLSEFDAPVVVETHDWYGHNFMPQPCFAYYGKKCPFHRKPYRTAEQYVWTVWDYENEQKRILMCQASANSPLEDLLEINDEHGTIGVPKDEEPYGFDVKITRLIRGTKTKYKARMMKDTADEKYVGKRIPFKQEKVYEILKGLIRIMKADADMEDDDEGGGGSGSGADTDEE